MDDWIASGVGAWLGKKWFGPWFKRHRIAGWGIFIFGLMIAVAVLTALN